MAQVPIDKEKVNRIVTATLLSLHDSGAHPVEVLLALGECIGRVLVATGEMGVNDVARRELFNMTIKQITNAVLAAEPKVKVYGGMPQRILFPSCCGK